MIKPETRRSITAIQQQIAGLVLAAVGRNQQSFDQVDNDLERQAGFTKGMIAKLIDGKAASSDDDAWLLLSWAAGDGVISFEIAKRDNQTQTPTTNHTAGGMRDDQAIGKIG